MAHDPDRLEAALAGLLLCLVLMAYALALLTTT